MADGESNDLFEHMSQLCRISASQEEILLRCPFVGEAPQAHHEASPSSGGIPVASTGIIMAALTAETIEDAGKDSGNQEVFHTPPEQSSLPTSQISEYAEAPELLNLSDDSELGFAQVKLKQRVDGELAAECSRGLDEVEADEIFKSEFDTKRKLSSKDSSDESPNKREKVWEQNQRFDSEKLACSVEETCDKRPEVRVLPYSIIKGMEKEAKEKEAKEKEGFVFEVLKALIHNCEGDSVDNVSWLHLAKARGFHFPRPRWRKENDDEKN